MNDFLPDEPVTNDRQPAAGTTSPAPNRSGHPSRREHPDGGGDFGADDSIPEL